MRRSPPWKRARRNSYRLLEEHFNDMGLTEAERDEQYARAGRRVISEGSAVSKSST